MASSVTVNGKEYLPSATLVSTSGYSADYISKLAREEKVLGTHIGRQWFVEPGSLATFIQKAEIQKEIKKQELREQRKLEQSGLFDKNKNTLSVSSQGETETKRHVDHKSHTAIAHAQAMVVLVCLVFTGALGWVAVSNGIGFRDLSVAVIENGSFIAESILPFPTNKEVLPVQQSNSYLAASNESVLIKNSTTTGKQNIVYTSLPQFSNRLSTSSATSTLIATHPTLTSTTSQLSVSDEVVVKQDADGNQIISPVFKDGTSSSEHFRIVSVVNKK